jgi:hypothetical protein
MGGTTGGGVIVKGTAAAAMLMVYVKLGTSRLALSVTSTVKVVAPTTVGVPVKTPPALRVRPTGSDDAGWRLQV